MNKQPLSEAYTDILTTYSQLVNAIDQENENKLIPLLEQLKTQINERLLTEKQA